MGPIDLAPAFRAIAIVCILVGIALGYGVPWFWEAALKPLLRILVM